MLHREQNEGLQEKAISLIFDLNQNRFHIVFTEAGVVLSKDLGEMQFLPAPGDRDCCSHGPRNEGAPPGRDLDFFGTCRPVPPQQNRNLPS